MSLSALDTRPSPQAIAAKDRSAPLKVTGKLRIALDAMVWEGARRKEAASIAGMTEHSVRSAFNKPHVKAYYLRQLEVLRNSERARNIHTLCEVRDDKSNKMARVQAVRTLEHMSEDGDAPRGGMAQVAGFVIVLREGAPQQAPMVDVTPPPTEGTE